FPDSESQRRRLSARSGWYGKAEAQSQPSGSDADAVANFFRDTRMRWLAAPNLIHRFRAKNGLLARSAPPNGPAHRSRRFLIALESNPRRARFCSEAQTAARSKVR